MEAEVMCGRRVMLFALLVAVFVCAREIAPQRTIIVDSAMGPGADYVGILEAYAESAPGDTFLVRRGVGYPYPLPPAIRHGLRIVGLGAVPVAVDGSCLIREIPMDQIVIVHNLDVGQSCCAGIGAYDCDGLVVMSRIFAHPSSRSGAGGAYYCDRVISTGLRLYQNTGGLAFRNSRGVVADCVVDPLWAFFPYQVGSRGAITVEDGSAVWVVNTTVDGGDYWEDNQGWRIGPDAGIAVVGPGSQVHVGGKSRIAAGRYLTPSTGCPKWPRSAASYLTRAMPAPPDPDTSLLIRDPGVAWEGCMYNGGAEQSLEFPTVHPGDAHPGQRQAVRATGATNSVLSVFASMIHPGRPIELPVGDVWLDPNLVVEIGCGAVDSKRELHLSTRIPDWMQPGDALMYQTVSLEPGGRWQISPPGVAVVW